MVQGTAVAISAPSVPCALHFIWTHLKKRCMLCILSSRDLLSRKFTNIFVVSALLNRGCRKGTKDPCPLWLLSKAKHGIGSWIQEVINTSLRDSRVSVPLKEAVVRPVLKKASLDPEMADNYRPVANIPFLGTVLERVVAGQLQALLDETDYLDPFQSGFRPGYGTESALVALYDDLCRERDRGSASLLVLLDLSVAFNTIDHGILLDRLKGLGVGGTAWQWFRSYLDGQFQKVVLGDFDSVPWQLCHGVPQGSILSPLLFNIYMKPLGEVIQRCGLRNHQYADDTQLYLSFSTNPGEAVAVLNWCLAEVMGWMRANKLMLNPDKTEVLLVGGSGFRVGNLDLVLNGVALPLKDRVRSLRVLLDPVLSLEAQVTVVARSAFLQLRLIHQLHPYLESDCLAMKSLILCLHQKGENWGLVKEKISHIISKAIPKFCFIFVQQLLNSKMGHNPQNLMLIGTQGDFRPAMEFQLGMCKESVGSCNPSESLDVLPDSVHFAEALSPSSWKAPPAFNYTFGASSVPPLPSRKGSCRRQRKPASAHSAGRAPSLHCPSCTMEHNH
ncbi:putative RNA-directed DNA polymerase from transposon BS [Varanus komodoensis]|nr:putative RNA-directed DNA polymerase from transposon BS [Varanus komodoensis]